MGRRELQTLVFFTTVVAVLCTASVIHADVGQPKDAESQVTAESDALAYESSETPDPTPLETSVRESMTEDFAGDGLSFNYFGILYGPSITNPTSFQPTESEVPDPNRPVLIKNFATVSAPIGDSGWGGAAGAYWLWIPVQGQTMEMRDPYLRLSHSSIYSNGGFNWYGDARVHPGVSEESRSRDQLVGLQTFHAFTYQFPSSRFMVGLYGSVRGNIYGDEGEGEDLILYAAPYLQYQLSPKVALSTLYEQGASHQRGQPTDSVLGDGSDIEPGVIWEVSPSFWINPYLHLRLDESVSPAFGMTLSWTPI